MTAKPEIGPAPFVLHPDDERLLGLAWLAGFIDGEGSIGVYRASDKRVGPMHVALRAALQIANTDRGSLEKARGVLEVNNSLAVVMGATDRRATQYRLDVREQAPLLIALLRLVPLLVVKRRQAELVCEFLGRRLALRGRGRYAAFGKREHEIYQELRELNRTGP